MEQKSNEDEDTFYNQVKKMVEEIGLSMDQIEGLKKNKLKEIVKEKIGKKMNKDVNETKKNMTKLRFIKDGNDYKIKKYIAQMQGHKAIQALKIRLNMIQIYGNYKADLCKRRLCPHCEMEDDTTEHLVECWVLNITNVNANDLQNDENEEMWKQLNEIVKINMDNRQ